MKKLIPVLLILFILACTRAEKHNISDLDWFVGNWTSKSGEDAMTEYWQKISDTLLTGEAWFISDHDTIATEQLKIVKRNNEILYIASPSGQATTEFKLTQLNDNEVMFENPDHDFPQKIYYKRLSPDSLYAKIEGLIHDQPQAMEFYWKLNVK